LLFWAPEAINVVMATTTWTAEKERILHDEVERRFRARTPAQDIMSADWRSRVPRPEIRSIATDHPEIGELPPELDREWGAAFAAWYVRMAKRVMRELDPDWRAVLKRMPPAPPWTRQE